MYEQNKMCMVLQDDCDVYNTICKVLEVFYISTNDFFSVYYSTTSFVITHIYYIVNNFKEHRDLPIFKDTCAEMKTNILKYWTNLPYIFMLSAVMEPYN